MPEFVWFTRTQTSCSLRLVSMGIVLVCNMEGCSPIAAGLRSWKMSQGSANPLLFIGSNLLLCWTWTDQAM